MPKLYLIPSLLAPDGHSHLAPITKSVVQDLNVFIVERSRTARRFLRSIVPDYPIDSTTIIELDKHDFEVSVGEIKNLLKTGVNIGFMSEAGLPCIADPGARIVNLARFMKYEIKPLSGPSSIMLGLMASGMNGQQFCFRGYLPIKTDQLNTVIRDMVQRISKSNETQIFIETPYRNKKILTALKKQVPAMFYLSIGSNLTGSAEKVITKQIKHWHADELDKEPCIFCLGRLIEY